MMAADDPFLQAPIDLAGGEFGDLYDELPLWSAPFGLLLLDHVPLVPGSVIVDVGSGTGWLSLELAQRSLGSTVHAVDPWAAACARLRRKLKLIGLATVFVHEQDASSLPLQDGAADLVVSNLGVNNFENAPAVLAECFRVLRRGGRIVLSTNLVGHMAEFYDVFRSVLPMANLEALESHIAHRATVPRVQAQLAAAGFTPGAVSEGSFRLRYADGEALLRHWFIRFGFMPAWIEVAGEHAEAALQTVASRLDGEVSLTVPMACIEGVKQ